MIAKIKPLGMRAANASAIRAAAIRIRAYVEGRQQGAGGPDAGKPAIALVPTDGTNETGSTALAAYYAAGSEGESVGRARGAGAGAMGLSGTVPSEQLVAVLCGLHAITHEPLLGPGGSTGRVSGAPRGSKAVARTGAGDESLSIPEAAFLAGVDPSHLRRLAEHQPRVVFPTPTSGAHMDPRVVRRLVELLCGQPVTPPATQYLLAGKDPLTGDWRVRRSEVERFIADRAIPETVMGFDLVCSAPKSVSLLWAVGDERLRADIADSFDAAVNATVGYLERHATFGMVDGCNLPGEGLGVVSYVHDTSRADEAHLHHHSVIVNAVRVVVRDDAGRPVVLLDGSPRVEWRALDSGVLMSHVRAAGYVGAAELRHQLTSRWGVAWGRVRSGVAELAAFPPELLAAFSTRHDQITEEFASLVASGEDADSATEEAAQRATRAPKRVLADEAVRAIQVERLGAFGWTPGDVVGLVGGQPCERRLGVSDDELADLFDRLAGPLGVTERFATFTSKEVHEWVAAWAVDRLPASQVRAMAEAFLADRRVVSVASDRTRRRTDPEPTFTTQDLLAVEDNLHTLYRQGRVDHGGVPVVPVSGPLIDKAITDLNHTRAEERAELSSEQADLVREVVSCGDLIRCVVGPAGTGKTEAMRAAVMAWRAAGYRVLGAANGGTQSEQLAVRLGVDSQVVASWLTRLDTASDAGEVWSPDTVVVLDEATQVSTRDAERLARWSRRTGTSLVCLGDPAQLGSVGAGGWFRHLVYAHGAPSLSTIYRQRGDDMEVVRRALSGLRSEMPERVRRGMDRLSSDGRVRVFDSGEQLLAATVGDWYRDRQVRLATPAGKRPPKPSRMMAAHLRDVDALNRLARARLAADGTLSRDEIEVAGRQFAVGDEVITLTQAGHTLVPAGASRHAYIRTGTVGVVSAINADAIEVTFPNKGAVNVDWAYLTHEFDDGRVGGLTHAYAITADRSQGSTMHAARAVATDATSRPALYVMLSRGERDVAAYLVRDRHLEAGLDDETWLPVLRHPGGPLEAVVDHLERSRAERLATDLDPVAWEAHQLRRGRTLDELSIIRQAATAQENGRELLVTRRAELATEAAIGAAAVERPHPVIVGRIGTRPPGGEEQRLWDRAVAAVACYHARWRPVMDGERVGGAGWAIGRRPADEPSSWATDRSRAETLVSQWVAQLPPQQGKRFWALIEHIPRERATAGIQALLGAGHHPNKVLEALLRREQDTARTGAAVLDWRVRKLCEAHGVDPTVFTLPPPMTRAAEWDHVRGLLDSAEADHLSRRPTPLLAAARLTIEDELAGQPGPPDAQQDLRDRHRVLGAALDLQVDRAANRFPIKPPTYLIAVLGPRPVRGDAARDWDQRARMIESWRHHRLGLPCGEPAAPANRPPSEQALGPDPLDDPAAVAQRRRLLDHTQATLDLAAGI